MMISQAEARASIAAFAAHLRGEGPGPAAPPAFPPGEAPGGRWRVGLAMQVCYSCGAEEQTRQLAAALDPARFSRRGLAILGGPGATDPAMVARFAAMMPVAFGRESALALARECDVLVGWDLGGLPGELSRLGLPSRPRVVLVGHSPPESDWGLHAMRQLDGVDSIVAVSELALGTISGRRRAGAKVIWNAIDEGRLARARSRPEMRASWGVPTFAKVVGMYARLSDEKDPGALLRLARELPEPWHVVAVGGGNLRGKLEAEARELGLHNAHFPGKDPGAGDVLAAFDWLISPSKFESFGLTMGEGLALGLPLLATPAGLVKLHPGLARPIPVDADGPTLAAALLADDADRAGRMARVARGMQFARERLSTARMGREWSDHLAGLVAARPVATAYRPAIDPAVRDRVNSCKHRGGVLPISMQREGCGCGELSECRAGRGKVAGRVSLRDCLDCKESA